MAVLYLYPTGDPNQVKKNKNVLKPLSYIAPTCDQIVDIHIFYIFVYVVV